MIVRLRYREWLDEDQGCPMGRLFYRTVGVPDRTDASRLCRLLGDVSLAEFHLDPVGDSDGRVTGRYFEKGELKNGAMYNVGIKRRSHSKDILKRFLRIEDGAVLGGLEGAAEKSDDM